MIKHEQYFNYADLSKEDLDLFNKQGFLLLRKILTPSGLEQMREECIKAWNVEKQAFNPSKSWLQNSLLVNIHHQSDGNYATDRDRRILFLRYADANAVEVYNNRKPRLGRLVKGSSIFDEVSAFEKDL